ncbi:hypothetical protein [Streptomyces sp. NPDC002057]|uniref:hypothetical protein n=1 Tax=Streptomyces sp. NPDC002057 TaxID=3154664 RepID=UPI003317443D
MQRYEEDSLRPSFPVQVLKGAMEKTADSFHPDIPALVAEGERRGRRKVRIRLLFLYTATLCGVSAAVWLLLSLPT